jgi:2-oxoisovalerate dehydrogenase E2 component (dihydrolipoyl transacylase)
VTALEAMRADLNANRGGRPKLTLLPLLIVAICRSLPDFPMLNARYDDEAGVVTRSGRVHLGMATQTDAGLTVPVIRDAQDQNVWQLATEIARPCRRRARQQADPAGAGRRHDYRHLARAAGRHRDHPGHQPAGGGDHRPEQDRRASGL